MSKRHRKRERRRRNKNKQKLSRTEIWIIAMLVVAILLVLAFIAVSLLWNDSKTVSVMISLMLWDGQQMRQLVQLMLNVRLAILFELGLQVHQVFDS